MPITIEGKKILVTGGARGIGGESARYFAAEGASVVTFDVKDDLGERLAKEATALGPGSVTYRHVDVTNIPEIRAGVEFAVQELGGLDAVFNVAGVAPHAPAEAIPEADWDLALAVNVKGLAYVCEAVFPHLKDRGGSIVNFASDAALMDVPVHSAAYSASKGAVISYTRTIGREWAKYGIRSNSVNPVVMTPIVDEARAVLSEEEKAQYAKAIEESIPLGGEFGDVTQDLAPVLLFLASDASKFMTSGIFCVNGGLAYVR
ncbi:SDR family NAD(P)-dependent oxidoreductase [Arthrobacter sp. ISL-28]|uniref:SDR family NAD(P)-dependent oxidoreductase n=1 Tax=Arthrobacter sp. ISL-28 TaxID=2819108 RepID=UPI001BE643B9|nr:SDR family NAD(P)-dependent oxidoreductase [Arthrobacter sp. ISL-28]MBT2523369.1 SDR family oxidoreductase [Arthrobacter sp. ISL-28]